MNTVHFLVKYMKDKNSRDFKKAVKITGGKYYTQSNEAVNSIVKDIEKDTEDNCKVIRIRPDISGSFRVRKYLLQTGLAV